MATLDGPWSSIPRASMDGLSMGTLESRTFLLHVAPTIAFVGYSAKQDVQCDQNRVAQIMGRLPKQQGSLSASRWHPKTHTRECTRSQASDSQSACESLSGVSPWTTASSNKCDRRNGEEQNLRAAHRIRNYLRIIRETRSAEMAQDTSQDIPNWTSRRKSWAAPTDQCD